MMFHPEQTFRIDLKLGKSEHMMEIWPVTMTSTRPYHSARRDRHGHDKAG